MNQDGPPAARQRGWKRYIPIAAIGAGVVALFASGATDYLSLDSLRTYRDDLAGLASAHPVLGPLALAVAYAVLTALSTPGMVWVTIASGFLFGPVIATISVLCGATAGATALMLAARTGFRDSFQARAGPWLKAMNREIARGEVSYMLAIRLIPIVPFWAANIAPAFLPVRTRTYIWTSFFGMMPGTFIFASLGGGLDAVLQSGGELNVEGLLTRPAILIPLAGLVVLALLPVIVRRWRARQTHEGTVGDDDDKTAQG